MPRQKALLELTAGQQPMPLLMQKMSLVFRNALMPSENQQVLRLRLVYFMRRLRLIIQLLGLSALLLGSIVGTFFVVSVVGLVLMMAIGSPGGANYWWLALLIFMGFWGLLALYWNFIVLKVFKHVRKSLRQKNS